MITIKRALALLTAALVATLTTAAGAKGPAKASVRAMPSAATFAAALVGATNRYALEHGDAARIGNAHCVEGAAGHYMCAYTATRGGVSTCHLMQGRWTSGRASAITVTLAGRTRRCGSVREAIRTLP